MFGQVQDVNSVLWSGDCMSRGSGLLLLLFVVPGVWTMGPTDQGCRSPIRYTPVISEWTLFPDERQAVPNITLMESSLKLSIIRKESNYTHNLSQYSPVPYECGFTNSTTATDPNGHVGWYNTKDPPPFFFFRRLMFIMIVIFTSLCCFYYHIHVFIWQGFLKDCLKKTK
jgi:hypothetical protein